MSQSVILNINESIQLSEHYWQSLREASAPLLSSAGLESDFIRHGLVYPLSYYYREKILEVSESLRLLEHSVKNGIYDFEVIGRIVDAGVALPKNATLARYTIDHSLLGDSLRLIELAWPAGYKEMQSYSSGFVAIDDDGIRSLTGPTWFGAVFLGKMLFDRSRLDDLATSILHEIGHLVLYAQSAIDPPMDNIAAEVYSPFVKRDRPAIMVFHAQIALARMIIWLVNLKQFINTDPRARDYEEKIEAARVDNSIRQYGICYLDAMENLRQIKLTSAGERCMADFQSIERLLKAFSS